MLKPFDTNKAEQDFKEYYDQTGSGAPSVFIGSKYQRGYGLGNIFSSLLKTAIPLVKKGALSLGRTALQTGVQIAKDGLEGKDIKTSMRRNLKSAGRQVITKGLNSLVAHVDGGNQHNKTRKRKRKTTNRSRHSNVKRPRRDIFS